MAMIEPKSDALVFFGATGDLAYKKIFLSLQAMLKRGHLDVPIIGVAKAGWTLDQFKARVRDSLEKHGGLDAAAFDKLADLLRYVDGDYAGRTTFDALRKQLGPARRPAHYLAIPPALFGTVVEQLDNADCANGARVIVEKPFGHDLASARRLDGILLARFDEDHILRIDHYLGKRPVHNNVASRMESTGLPDKIQVSQEVYARLKDGFLFEARGLIKGQRKNADVVSEREKGIGNSARNGPGRQRTPFAVGRPRASAG
jgi:glucose-6-phosphate 1-dehydrogenase